MRRNKIAVASKICNAGLNEDREYIHTLCPEKTTE
jgi:hypothetical protein